MYCDVVLSLSILSVICLLLTTLYCNNRNWLLCLVIVALSVIQIVEVTHILTV